MTERTIKFTDIEVKFIDKMGSDARVRNCAYASFGRWLPEDQFNEKGLLDYLATGLPKEERDDWEKLAKAHTHWTTLAHCQLTIICKAPLFLARQLVKHQVGLCLSGDTEVTFVKKVKGVSNGTYTKTLKEIADHWFGKIKYQGGEKGKRNVSGSHIRVFNEETQRFETSHIVDVIDSGIKQTFTITDEFGNNIRATEDHSFLTMGGWKAVKDLTTDDLLIRTDTGSPFAYAENQRGSSPDVIVRRDFRKTFADVVKCENCRNVFDVSEVHADHIIPVADGGEHTLDNMQALCGSCHEEKSATEKRGKTTLLPKYVRIVKIEDFGMEQCFDITVEGIHNFLGNGFVVHNCWNEESRRYIKSDVELYLPKDFHKAPDNAKQGASKHTHKEYVWTEWGGKRPRDGVDRGVEQVVEIVSCQAVEAYYDMLDAGVAPEEARMVLPLNSMTNWVWTGSLVAFNRVYQQRIDGHAQLAAQEFAYKLGEILYEHFPHSMESLNYGNNPYVNK